MNLKMRIKAAGIHAASSLVVAALAALLVFGVWYPGDYMEISGGRSLFLLIVSVDVILGPCLTFAIFDLSKGWKVLRRDLAVIVVLQLAAIGYGVHTMALARPVLLSLEGTRFRVVPAYTVVTDELARAPEGLRTLSWTGPRLIFARQPVGDEVMDAVTLGLAGQDLSMRPRFWQTWGAAGREAALKAGKPLDKALKATPSAAVQAAAARTGLPMERLLYMPMLARANGWSVLIDKSTGDPVGFAPLDGF